MAFDSARLQKMAGGGGAAGLSWYQYVTDGTDTLATCEEDGYFNNTDDNLNLRVGDMIYIVVPGTQAGLTNAELKQVVDMGIIVVMAIASGAVDCSADMLAGTLTYT